MKIASKTLSQILDELHEYTWNEWVYLKKENEITAQSECIVLNPDDSDIGEDDFTPIAAEKLGMNEFLSIQDITSVRDNLLKKYPNANNEKLVKALDYYFKNDAFMPA